jgi:hypothetical protein
MPPPAGGYLAGTEFTVEIGGAAYGFKTVDLGLEAKPVDQSNSKYDPGFESINGGQKRCTLDLEGPYIPGEVPITVGDSYEWTYNPQAALVGFVLTGILLKIKHSNDVEKGPRMALSIQSTGTFEPTLS